MTQLQTVLANSGSITQINEIVRSLSPAGLYGINPATTTGLTLGFYGGQFSGATVADGTVTLTASNTNYVVAHRTTGAVTAAVTTTNWLDTANYLQLYQLVAGASTFTIAATSDKRQAFGGASAGSFTGGTLSSALNEAPPATIASSATVDIGAAAANSVTITGTTTITAFDSIPAGAKREVVFSGALTLTHNATSLILPTGASITTAAGDVADFVSLGSGNWRCTNYMRASGAALSGSPFSGGTLTSALNEAPQVALASAATVNIGAAAANTVTVSGTTTITAFDTIATGAIRRVRFLAALTLTHNATSLILPGAANITTAAGDVATMESLGSGDWRCINYSKADGTSVVGGGGGSVAGSDKQVQYNNAGDFGAEAGFEYDQTTNTLTVPKINESKGADIASASTTDIGAASGNFVHITGTTTITAFGTVAAGARRLVVFDGALTLTHNATSLILPTGASITTAAGDTATCVSEGAGNWRVTSYARKDGTSLVGGGGSLTNWTESVNSSAPNATVPAVRLLATNAATNVDAVIAPKGSGALLANTPDSAATGGNKRGIYAVDLQLSRAGAAQVASGQYATIAGGLSNAANGNYSFTAGRQNDASGANSFCIGMFGTSSGDSSGAMGNSCSATGTGAFAIGYSCTAGGNYSRATGYQSTTRNVIGSHAHSGGQFSAAGDSQFRDFVFRVSTTNATTTAVTADASVVGGGNQINIASSGATKFRADVVARRASNNDAASWSVVGFAKNVGGTITFIGTPTVTQDFADAGATGWVLAVAVDNGNAAVTFNVTGAAATTIRWVVVARSAEVIG